MRLIKCLLHGLGQLNVSKVSQARQCSSARSSHIKEDLLMGLDFALPKTDAEPVKQNLEQHSTGYKYRPIRLFDLIIFEGNCILDTQSGIIRTIKEGKK